MLRDPDLYRLTDIGLLIASATTATPKKNVFGSAAKIAYNASPVKASSSPAKARSNRPHTFDANEEGEIVFNSKYCDFLISP